jgi:hypothetical protein
MYVYNKVEIHGLMIEYIFQQLYQQENIES